MAKIPTMMTKICEGVNVDPIQKISDQTWAATLDRFRNSKLLFETVFDYGAAEGQPRKENLQIHICLR